MEILTHDDTESIKFIHGPRFRLCNGKPARILICNPLKYLILERDTQIIIFDLNIVLSNPDGLAYFESNFDELKQAQLGKYDISHESIITHMALDCSSTILTIVVESKILLFDLLNIGKKSEWMSINHDGIQSLIWTRNHDIITIETDGSCFLYHFIPSKKSFYQTKLILNGNSDGFILVEAFKSSFCEIEFILITENEKNIVFITNELYNKIISCQSKSFTIPKSFVRVFSILIEPILDIFQDYNSKANLISQLHITSAKFIDGEDLYLSISLIRALEYVDGYVLFFKIDDNMKLELSSYSINDLCFDNVDSNDLDQIKKIRCVSFWVKEWGILFIGSAVFSQMVVFTCNHLYINKEDLSNYIPQKWVRLAMCEGYDINCTDFDIGIFGSCLCTCNPRSIRDPKSAIDAPKIHQPPVIFIAETNGDIITHYIGGNPELIKPIESEKVASLITNEDLQNNSNYQDLEVYSKVPTAKHLYNSLESPLKHFNITKNYINGSLSAVEQILAVPKHDSISREVFIINKSGKKLFDSVIKIDSQVSQLEKKFIEINDKVFNVLNSPLIKGLLNSCEYVDETELTFSESIDFYQLISKYNEISNIEIQLRRIHLYLMKKISDEVYRNTNIEILKEKLRKNELTSSQISILFQYNIELLDIFPDNIFDDNQTILNLLITIERLSLKLASRISQVSVFCERLNSRKSSELEFALLPPPEYNYKILNFNDQGFATPNKIHFDSQLNTHSKKIISSSVRISKKKNFDSQLDSKEKPQYSSKRNIHLSDIINNISSSLINDDLYKLSFSQNDESNLLKSQKLKINNFVNQTNTPGRYIKVRSKIMGHSCNEIRSDNLGVVNKSTLQKNNPFFTLSWIPGLAENNISPVKLIGNPSHIFGTDNKYIKSGILSSTLKNCIERLERIVDHCEIANGSISFIEREELIPEFINKINRDSVQSIEGSNSTLLNGSRIVTSQLLLSRNSSLQKNMIYRQKLSLIISGFVSELSENRKSAGFPKNKNCSRGNLMSNIYSKFNYKDSSEDKSQKEYTEPNSFTLSLGQCQNIVPFDNKTSPSEHQVSIDTNDLLYSLQNIPEKTSLKDFKISSITELKERTILRHKVNTLEAVPVINSHLNSDNYAEPKLSGKDNIKTNANGWQKIIQETKQLEVGSKKSDFTTNNLIPLMNYLGKTTCDSISSDEKFITMDSSNLKNEIVKDFVKNRELKGEEDIKSSFFPLGLTKNDTPNSKRASEGLFAFSTEMNVSLSLMSPASKIMPLQDQVSNESNIFSFSPDSNPLKTINNCSHPKKIPDTNNLSCVKVRNELNKLDELSVPKVNESVFGSSISSTAGNSDPSYKIKDTNERVEQKFGDNSKTPITLGGEFGFSNFLTNSNVPKASGFGSSQFLTNGPFSSNNSGNSLCVNSKNDSCIEEPQSFKFPTTDLDASTPFKTLPASDNSMGGFATFSSEFHGFPQINAQNSTSNAFSTNSSNNFFNFAPPQKPRQVNKLD
ncbi:Low complexity [Cryptosporidium sp. chipmunk genotype I]|uniref:Low complexity n=1 Tax=Cryptosporidium sp. chipmunk genotype I TaxID=1280935 RepID=UPI003519E49A|nr:Low complexity [Cryptosporidium sp. chipmunk genotype I]